MDVLVQTLQPQRRGSISDISSAGVDAPASGLSLYSATQAAVNRVTRTAAVECGAHGIRVNAVAPSFVETAMTTYRYRDAKGQIDVATAILYLASDARRFATGELLRPNGGVSMP